MKCHVLQREIYALTQQSTFFFLYLSVNIIMKWKKILSAEELMLLSVVLKKTLESPWTARRSNQSILKEISPEYSLEGLMLKLKLKLQYFGHLMQRTDSLGKTPVLGKIEGGRRRE